MRLVNFGKKALGVKKLSILPRVREALMVQERRQPLTDSLRAQILSELAEDMDLLGELIGRDLGHWKV